MDEVDKIIIASLRQVGFSLEAAVGDAPTDGPFNMAAFTPSLLVRAVVACLNEIRPNAALPQSLPENLAQRFACAAQLAEQCAASGYRSDIGYQTFLYPNVVDVRRLLMFLIEQLPKENGRVGGGAEPLSEGPIGAYEALRRQFRAQMRDQLQTPWVPPWCRRRAADVCAPQRFAPQLNLHVPAASAGSGAAVQSYWQLQAPNVFQQTAGEAHDLVSSVLHRQALDAHGDALPPDTLSVCSDAPVAASTEAPPVAAAAVVVATSTTTTADPAATATSPLESLGRAVHDLKQQNDQLLNVRRATTAKLNELKALESAGQRQLETLRRTVKVHERTSVVLENPEANVAKLEALIASTEERRRTLNQQWLNYRQPLADRQRALQAVKQSRNLQNVVELRALIGRLEEALRARTAVHAQLSAQLQAAASAAGGTAPRSDYTRRIHEFIGSIRKQRSDIFKVLDDTRDLQKQLNAVAAQLQRQFNYTDDLLFQSAKHDLHAKKAYKLLATLHAACNELVEVIVQTGSVTKAIRELEVQVDRERLKNVASSLDQISSDIRRFEAAVRAVQSEIRGVENEIVAA